MTEQMKKQNTSGFLTRTVKDKDTKCCFQITTVITAGCSSSFKLSPQTQGIPNQDVIYSDGNEIAISVGEETTVGLFGEKPENGEIKLFVYYLNDSDKSINVDPTVIIAESVSENNRTFGEKQSLSVYSAEEYLKKLKRDQMWVALAQGLQAASDSYNAGYSSSTTTGYVGNTQFYANTQTYDASKQAEMQQQNINRMQQTAALNAFQNASTSSILLRKNTLFPKQSVSGYVMVKYRYAKKYEITIPVENDLHKFILIPSP